MYSNNVPAVKIAQLYTVNSNENETQVRAAGRIIYNNVEIVCIIYS